VVVVVVVDNNVVVVVLIETIQLEHGHDDTFSFSFFFLKSKNTFE
jgi:hypothetical protein